MKNTGGPRFFD